MHQREKAKARNLHGSRLRVRDLDVGHASLAAGDEASNHANDIISIFSYVPGCLVRWSRLDSGAPYPLGQTSVPRSSPFVRTVQVTWPRFCSESHMEYGVYGSSESGSRKKLWTVATRYSDKLSSQKRPHVVESAHMYNFIFCRPPLK